MCINILSGLLQCRPIRCLAILQRRRLSNTWYVYATLRSYCATWRRVPVWFVKKAIEVTRKLCDTARWVLLTIQFKATVRSAINNISLFIQLQYIFIFCKIPQPQRSLYVQIRVCFVLIFLLCEESVFVVQRSYCVGLRISRLICCSSIIWSRRCLGSYRCSSRVWPLSTVSSIPPSTGCSTPTSASASGKLRGPWVNFTLTSEASA